MLLTFYSTVLLTVVGAAPVWTFVFVASAAAAVVAVFLAASLLMLTVTSGTVATDPSPPASDFVGCSGDR